MSDDSGFVSFGAEGGSSFLVSNGSLLPFLEAKKSQKSAVHAASRAFASGLEVVHFQRMALGTVHARQSRLKPKKKGRHLGSDRDAWAY